MGYSQYTSSKLQNYNKTRYNVENPATVILLLYETAISSLRHSVSDIDHKNYEGAHKNIVRAKMIVAELTYNLNAEAAGELGKNLKMLYDYIYYLLLDANIHKDKKRVIEAVTLLKNLYEGWKGGLKEQDVRPAIGSERPRSLTVNA